MLFMCCAVHISVFKMGAIQGQQWDCIIAVLSVPTIDVHTKNSSDGQAKKCRMNQRKSKSGFELKYE